MANFIGSMALGAVGGALAGLFVGGPIGAGIGAAEGATGGATGAIDEIAKMIFDTKTAMGALLASGVAFCASAGITLGISTAMGTAITFGTACAVTAATGGFALLAFVGLALIYAIYKNVIG